MKLLKWISVADRLTKSYLDNQFAALGINSSQHMYLLKICRNPGILQDSLIQSFYIHPSNIIRMISSLEKNGFLTKEPYDKDKRTCLLYPTQKALDIVHQVQKICDDAEALLMDGLSDEEKIILNTSLIHVGKNIARKIGMERIKDEFD